MKVILTAFQGRLKSEPMEIPPSAQYEFNLIMTKELTAFSMKDGSLGIAPSVNQEKRGRFVPTRTTEDGVQIYELVDIS